MIGPDIGYVGAKVSYVEQDHDRPMFVSHSLTLVDEGK